MSTRKYLSGYEKLQKREKNEKQIESQKGYMDNLLLVLKKHNRKFGWKYYKWTRNLSKRVGR